MFVYIFSVQDRPAVGVHDDRSCGTDDGTLGPAFHLVGLYGLFFVVCQLGDIILQAVGVVDGLAVYLFFLLFILILVLIIVLCLNGKRSQGKGQGKGSRGQEGPGTPEQRMDPGRKMFLIFCVFHIVLTSFPTPPESADD